MPIRVIAPVHAFLDGTYDDISTGQTRELVLMGEADGDVSIATGDQVLGIGAGPKWVTDVVADVKLVPNGSVGDGIYVMDAGQVGFLLIGRLWDREAGRNVAVGDRIGASMTFMLNAGEYLDLLSPRTQMPVHVCRIDRIQLGDRGSAKSPHQATLPAMRGIVWRDIEVVRFRDASRFAFAPFYLLECQVVSQRWRTVERVLDGLFTPLNSGTTTPRRLTWGLSPRIAVTFGLISIVLTILGPIAWTYAHTVVRGLERDPEDPRGLRWATAGRSLGMIATFLLVAVLLVGLLLGVPVAEDELGGSLGVAAERWRG